MDSHTILVFGASRPGGPGAFGRAGPPMRASRPRGYPLNATAPTCHHVRLMFRLQALGPPFAYCMLVVSTRSTPGRSRSGPGRSRPLQGRYRTLQAAPGGIIPGSWCPNEPGLVPRRPEHPPKTLQCRHKTINNCVSLRTCAISCFVMLSARSDGSKGELPPAEICPCP